MRRTFYSILLAFLLFIYPACNVVCASEAVIMGDDDDDADDDDDDADDGDDTDDDDDDDDDDDEDDDDDGDDDDAYDDPEEDPLPDDPEPYETVEVRGYNYGYDEGKKDGVFDSGLSSNSPGQRAYQVNDPESLYSTITDPGCTESENKRIGYPRQFLPVSADGLDAYLIYAGKWQEGYRDGYSYGVGEGAEEGWYEKGYVFGCLDARNDLYDPEAEHGEDDRVVRNGYYEPDHEDSLYHTLQGKYGDAYRAGYDAGWKDGLDSFTGDVDYGSAVFDPWRITTCPGNWDTSERLMVQTDMELTNAYYGVEEDSFMDYEGDYLSGFAAACSPFAWYFSEDSTYIRDGEVINRKDESLIQGVNTGIADSENWLYRAVDAGDGLYLLIRYRVGSMADYRNFKVRRFYYTRENGDSGALMRECITDHINDYYNGNESVVAYDSRKIVDMERKVIDGEEKTGKNTKGKRREICAEGVLVQWEKGKAAGYLGKIDLKAYAKNNVHASVSGDNMLYLGDRYINGCEIGKNERYYRVSRDESLDDSGERKEKLEKVTFAGTKSVGKLSKEDNELYSGEGPSFTLKIRRLDKGIAGYKKAVNAALKDQVFNFEIARVKISREEEEEREEEFSSYSKRFTLRSPVASRVEELKPEAPRRRDYEDYDSFMEAVKKYEEGLKALNDYYASDEFKTGFLKELQEARKKYMEEYRSLVSKYGSKMGAYGKYVTENILPEYVDYTYKKKYSEDYFKDGNKDGTVSRIEQWEYDNLYGPFALDDPDHYNFNGKFDNGENILPDPEAYNADYGTLPDFDDVNWIVDGYYVADTVIFLDDASAGDFKGMKAAPYAEPPVFNEYLYTLNGDVRLSLGKLKTVKKKEERRLKIRPSFVFYMGEDSDGEYTRVSKRSIKISGTGKNLSLRDKMVADQPILLLHGENDFEGDIAIRLRASGEAGYGIWRDEGNNYIDSLCPESILSGDP